MKIFTKDEIAYELSELPGWQFTTAGIQKQFQPGSFLEAIALVNRVADAAETANHHPDILINYDRVTFTLITHDAGGLTQRDFDLAARIEVLAS